jgi:hypothetical protein
MSDQPETPHEFAAILVTHAKGRAHDTASKLLRELVEAVKLTGKKGDVTKAGRTGQLEVPQTVQLELRPWEGHPQTYRVDAWFRLSVSEGSLRLAIKLKPTRQIVREAWADLTAGVIAATGKPVYAQP